MPVLLPNGNLLVPVRVESEDGNVIGDGAEEIGPDMDDYVRWLPFLGPTDRKRAEAFMKQANRKAA